MKYHLVFITKYHWLWNHGDSLKIYKLFHIIRKKFREKPQTDLRVKVCIKGAYSAVFCLWQLYTINVQGENSRWTKIRSGIFFLALVDALLSSAFLFNHTVLVRQFTCLSKLLRKTENATSGSWGLSSFFPLYACDVSQGWAAHSHAAQLACLHTCVHTIIMLQQKVLKLYPLRNNTLAMDLWFSVIKVVRKCSHLIHCLFM